MTSLTRLLLAWLAVLLPFPVIGAGPPPKPLPAADSTPTVIDSDRLEMVTLEEETHFVFSDNVIVTATNMTVRCDRLEVFAGRHANAAEGEQTNELGRIQRIFAIGNVRIEQEGRQATSGRAEVFPQEGMIVLTENPVIEDSQGRVSGERIVLYQGESRAVVESGATQPARVFLPTLPDLGADPRRPTRENGSSND
jgi:lipopolysaccharide transport protein LptA